jgi:hypothetical protein
MEPSYTTVGFSPSSRHSALATPITSLMAGEAYNDTLDGKVVKWKWLNQESWKVKNKDFKVEILLFHRVKRIVYAPGYWK